MTLRVVMSLFLLGAISQATLADDQTPLSPKKESSFQAPNTAAIAKNNQGVGLMGRYEYAAALALFSELAKAYPRLC